MQLDCTLMLNICSMNSLGFKNFRKFTDLKPIEFKGITFLVGRNNAGKSTFVKAVILVIEYLKHRYIDEFPIANLSKADLNLSNFGKIKTLGQNEDSVVFEFAIDIYDICLKISGNDYLRTANVIELKITDTQNGYEFEAKPELMDYYIRYDSSIYNKHHRKSTEEGIANIKLEIAKIEQEIKDIDNKKDLRAIAEKNNMLGGLNGALKYLENRLNELEDNEEENFTISYMIEENHSIKATFNEVISIAEDNYGNHRSSVSNDNETDNDIEQECNRKLDYENLYVHINRLVESYNKLFTSIANTNYKYLDSFSVKQNSVLLIKDKSNALMLAIDDFMSKRIQNGQIPYEFIQNWMNILEVGQDFKVETIRGEAYVVEIVDNTGTINLADKGMGSIQIMLLLFRLASAIHDATKNKLKTILFI